ncbi:MAG TPA: hypothetical protein VMR21_10110 [Vicinamibacteria bacterium]|nr:hypothetical protein [Vicinamibacteria bacterium]
MALRFFSLVLVVSLLPAGDVVAAENEFETSVRAVWKRADELFSYPNQKGSETGCGQVLALLGRPEEIRGPDEVGGLTTSARFDNLAHVRDGSRQEAAFEVSAAGGTK